MSTVYSHRRNKSWRLTSSSCRIQVGDQFSDTADQGPHNSKVQYDKILGYIEEGKKEGATLHLGGNAVKDSKEGYFIEVRELAAATVSLLIDARFLANNLHGCKT